MKKTSIRRLLGLALLSVSSHLMAAAPTLSWTSTVDTGTTVGDATRLIRKVNNGDLIVASQTGSGAAAGFRVQRVNTTTGTAIWTTNTSPGDTGDDPDDIVIDPATGDAYISCRLSFTGNLLDWYVFKVRGSDGVIQWSYTYNGPFGAGNDVIRSICMTSDGNIVAAGQISRAVTGAIGGRVIKLNSASGALMWEYLPSVDWQEFHQVVADSAGNAIATGYIDGASLNTENGYTVKLNAGGGEAWTSTFNGTANDFDSALAVAVDTSDNVYIAVESRLTGTNDDIVVAKLAAGTGFEQWRSTVTGAIDGTDVPTVIQLDGSNNVYVAGQVKESASANHAALAKLNPSTGAVAWKSVVDGTDPAGFFENFRCIAFNGSEVYAATTIQNTISATAQNDIFVGRFDPANGSLLWSINYNSTGTKTDNLSNKKGASLIAPATDTIYVCGTSQNPAATQTDGVLLKFAPAGPVGPVAPSVTTATQSAVTHNSATLGGDVTADGGATVTERGIVWGLAASPTTADNKVQMGSGTGAFSGTVTGLPPGTTINVRAYAINSVNTSYGPNISFNTLPAVAVVSITRSNASPTNALTVNWTVTFASAVPGLTASNFTLTGGAATGSVIGAPTTSNSVAWNVLVTTGSTDGLLTLNLANATGLSTAISTPLPFTGQSYTIDKTPPTVLSVTRQAPTGQTTNANSVTFRVTYSEPVNLTTPLTTHYQVVPVGGSTIVGTVQSVTGTNGTNTRDVTVQLTSGTGEFKLRVLD